MEKELKIETFKKKVFDQIDSPDLKLYLDCVHCGFCLPTCPTYIVLGNEMDSPRGRIYLIRAASQGEIGISEEFVKHMDLCLLCRNCETTCPSGVNFGSLMETVRDQIEQHYRHSPSDQRFRDLILRSFTNLDRLKIITKFFQFYQKSGIQRIVKASGILKLLGRLGKMEALIPILPNNRQQGELPEVIPPIGEKRGRVGLLLGCVQRFFFSQVNMATARVLSEYGFEVVIPAAQECCGSLFIHEGMRKDGIELAKKTIDIFDKTKIDFIVVNAAGCGSSMKEYGRLLQNDPVYAEKAKIFSRKIRDVSEFLAKLPLESQLKELNISVTYHDACHLAHGQKITKEPRALIEMIPGLRFIELEESDFCCGSAGIYNLLYPELAQTFLERKVERIKKTGAQIVVSGNPGCTLHIEKGLREHGLNVRLIHPVELLYWSIQGRMS